MHENDTDKIKVSINVTNDTVEEGAVGMREAFQNVVRAIESALSGDEICAYFNNLVSSEYMVTEILLVP